MLKKTRILYGRTHCLVRPLEVLCFLFSLFYYCQYRRRFPCAVEDPND